jgi:1-deoxy-D-xylulose-5-phosphate synthase
MVNPSADAAAILEKNGVEATVINARFVKPLDAELIMSAANKHAVILTVEEAYLAGGFGSAVIELLESNDALEQLKVVRMGVPDEIVTHGDPKLLLAKYGLNPDGIARRVREVLAEINEGKVNKRRLKAVK